MRILKIDVTKIDKAHLFKGAKGTYLDAACHDNKGGRDEFGNDGFITQSVSKEARAQGIKGPIIGNWKKLEPRTPKAESDHVKAKSNGYQPQPDEDETLPF